jgi:CheY-like chemotaxis protein
MWQALVVAADADLLKTLREQLEAPGYAVVEAGTDTDANQLLQTSGPCLLILLAPLVRRLTSGPSLAPACQDTRLNNQSAYLLLAANPPPELSTTELTPTSRWITVVAPENLEELLEYMEHAVTSLGVNPALLTAPWHSSQGCQLDEFSEQGYLFWA